LTTTVTAFVILLAASGRAIFHHVIGAASRAN
jgi:hypothetical protein